MAEEDRIEVAIINRTVYLKPFGLATQENSLGIPGMLRALFQTGCRSVAFDLEECKGMDSTFMGVMADAATVGPQRTGKNVFIFNATDYLVTLMRRTGLLPLVRLHEGKVGKVENLELCPIDSVHLPKDQRMRLQTIKELHQKLAALNERNKRAFGPFIKMLEEELQQGPPEEPEDR